MLSNNDVHEVQDSRVGCDGRWCWSAGRGQGTEDYERDSVGATKALFMGVTWSD
jgi:hypothetical protein